ncbi:gustatory and odorant receptor 22-like [Macrosteles quadrilineatus]|uniref:gustatory and odorant receptor 22-like n=1 Tax=Macrosteles quadrilineatus TaxID=74068 RepID=UPI0023E1BC30|nr:gustatory and odorant receptor 22-like [Macrosteles quadrilineatus]
MGYMPYGTDYMTSKINVSFKAVFWAIFSFAVQSVVMTWGNQKEFNTEDNFKSYVRVLYFTLRLINTNTTIFFFLIWWEMPKIIRYVNKWLDFEEKMSSVAGVPKLSLTPQRVKWITAVFTVLLILIITTDQYLFYNRFCPILVLTYFFSTYMNLLLSIFWILNCIFIAGMASNLRNSLVNLLLTKPDRELVNAHRLLWVELRDQVNQFAEAMRLPFMIHIFINHIALIFNTYTLLTVILASKDTSILIDVILPQIWTVVTVVSICEAAHYACQEIGQKFICTVLSGKSSFHDVSITKEVDLLLETMQKNHPEIVLGGCISVGRGLLIQTITAELTYNIVLSQFDLSIY